MIDPTRAINFTRGHTTLLVRVAVLLVSLTPLMWFHYGQTLKTVDSFFPVHFTCCDTSGFYAWDARSGTGLPTNLAPIAVFQFLLSWFATHIGVSVTEAATLAFFAAVAALGMSFVAADLVRLVHPGIAAWVPTVTGGITGVLWILNPFALSYVWYHTLFLEATWAVLPWLLFVLLRGMTQRWSIPAIMLTTIGISVIGTPGILEVLIPSVAALLFVFCLAAVAILRQPGDSLRSLAARPLAGLSGVALGQAWWLLPAVPALHSLYAQATSTGPTSRQSLDYASHFSGLGHVVTLTAVPQIYATNGTARYIAWGGTVTSWPGRALIWVTPLVALLGVVLLIRSARTRLAGCLMAVGLTAGVFFAKGEHAPFGGVNVRLLDLPFGEVLRHPVDKLSPFIVTLICLLFAVGLAKLLTVRLGGLWAAVVGAVTCVGLGMPWLIGTVVPQASGPMPSSWTKVPASYESAGRALRGLPVGGKTMVLPFSTDGFTAFRWRSGVQPNLDCLFPSWMAARSTLCQNTGYEPADRVGTLLNGALLNRDPRVFALARLLGVDSWVVHRDWNSHFAPEGPLPSEQAENVLGPSKNPESKSELPSSLAVEPGLPLNLSVRVTRSGFGSEALLDLAGTRLQVNEASTPGRIFFGLNRPADDLWLPGVSLSKRGAHTVSLTRTARGVRLWVDGRLQRGGYRMSGGDVSASLPELTEVPTDGNVATVQPRIRGIDVATRRSPDPSLVRPVAESHELAIWDQPALPLIYSAQSTTCTSDEPSRTLTALAWKSRSNPAPVVLDRACGAVGPTTLTWSRSAPTKYTGTLGVRDSAVLVFGQSFDRDWKLELSGSDLQVERHAVANGYANAWLIRGSGRATFAIRYAQQAPVTVGFIVGGVLLLACFTGGAVWVRRRVTTARADS